MEFTEDEKVLIWLVDMICACISIISCLFICITYCCYPSLRGYEFRLIFYLTFSDLLASLVYLVPPHDNILMCKFQGAFLTLTANLRLVFSAVIAHSIHITYKNTHDFFKEHETKSLIVISLVCIGYAGLPFSTDNYGQAAGVCWISISGDKYMYGTIWRLTTLYIPLWTVLLYNCVVYYNVIKTVRSMRSTCLANQMYIDKVIKKLLSYPLILTIGWLPATINRILAIFEPNDPNLYLTLVSFGFLAGLGFFNAIAYGLTPVVQYAICKSCLGRRSNLDSYTSISIET